MAHVRDRWTIPNPSGTRPKRVPNARWGKGLRWQARWIDKSGAEKVKAFGTEDEALTHIAKVVAGVPTAEASGLRFSEFAASWQKDQVGHRPNTARNVDQHLETRILPKLGDLDLATITRTEVQAAVVAWTDDLAPRTVRATYRTMATILRAAHADRLIGENPCVRIKLPAVERERIIPLTRAQVEALRDAMHPELRTMVTVAAATGLRIGELRGLTIDRITRSTLTVDRQLALDGGTEWVPVKTPASNRVIGLPKVARSAIDAHVEKYGTGPDGLIWLTVDGKPLAHRATNTSWSRARGRVTVDAKFPARGGWHMLRHYCASLLIASGLSVRAVADWLGHDDPSVTLKIYAHLWPTDTTAAVKAIDDALG